MNFKPVQRRHHNCPFLEHGTKCTHKEHSKEWGKNCGYSDCNDCPYYNDSKSIAKVDSTPLKTNQRHKDD